MISSDFIFNFIEFPNEFLHSGYIFVYFHFLLLLPSVQFGSTVDFKQWSKISFGACAHLQGTNILWELIFYYCTHCIYVFTFDFDILSFVM